MPLSGQDVLFFADVIERLRAAADEDRPIDAAQMHLINLQAVIRAAGPTWPMIKDNIRLGSLRFLKSCVAERDIVIPAGDGFLIIFASGDVPAMKARAEELRGLLHEFYIGQKSPVSDLQVEVEQRRVEPHELNALIAAPAKPIAEHSADVCLFAPVWSASAQVIASYFCTPARGEGGDQRFGYDRAYAATGASECRDYGKLDVAMLDAAQAGLERIGGADPHPLIGVSVHATTIQNRAARASFLERLARFDPDSLRHLCIKIAEIDLGAPMINIADWVGILRARVRSVVLEFHFSELSVPDLRDIGVFGAGYTMPAFVTEPGPEMAARVRQMRRWAESLARQQKRFFIDDLRHPLLIRAAAEAGASFITSATVWPAQKWPGAVVSTPAPAIAPFPRGENSLSSARS